MKLIVQIPCFNEERTLRETLADIPRRMEGVDEVQILVIDDGSTDATARVAVDCGADHVVRHTANMGLARAFQTGLDACLRLGADIIVNTDADNQYSGACIPDLVRPILNCEADIVVGDRRTDRIAHFSRIKRRLQKLGSLMVRRLSGTRIPDAVSGFRALSREAAMRINIVSSFSYTIEMLIQAGHKGMAVATVPIRTNRVTRQSRLFHNVFHFVERSAETMARIYTMYHPLRVFSLLGVLLMLGGGLPIIRFLYFYFRGDGSGHVQSLVLGGVLFIVGFVTLLIGLLADLISFNRQLIEMALERIRRMEALPAGETAGGSVSDHGPVDVQSGPESVAARRDEPAVAR
jgi:glycosyltransferase involved in cell wall biosynthesis